MTNYAEQYDALMLVRAMEVRLPKPAKLPREWIASEQRYSEPPQPIQRFELAKPDNDNDGCPTIVQWLGTPSDKTTVRR